MKSRLYFLDNLRGVTILMVVALHVFLCYMRYAPPWWFVIDPQQSMFFTYCVVLIDVPIMPVMFFIAGYFALPSLQRHGVARFWQQKFKRIVIPWVAGILFLSPPAIYMILLSRGKAPDYLEFWGKQFWTDTFFSQSVFWFLGLLVLFYLLLTGMFLASDAVKNTPRKIRHPGIALPAVFIGIASGWFLLMNQFFPPDTWFTHFYVIIFQPLRLLIYLLYFILGILAWKQRWFEEGGFMPGLLPWTGLCVLSAVLYLHFKMQMAIRGGELPIQAGNAFFFNLFAFSTMMSGFALFRLLFNGNGPLWTSFSGSSYGIYFLHSIPVYYGAYFLLSLNASAYSKAALLLPASLIICWVTTATLKKNAVLAKIL